MINTFCVPKTKLVIAAGALDMIAFTTPAPGKYRFLCGLHADDNMGGTLHVQSHEPGSPVLAAAQQRERVSLIPR